MKILAISTQVIPTPPPNYGGLEQVVWNHCKGLKALGEDVTLIGAKGSKAPDGVDLYELEKPGTFDKTEETAYYWYKSVLPEFDVVLDHSWYKWSYLAGEYLPVIGTMHSPCPHLKPTPDGKNMMGAPPPKRYPCMCGVSAEHSVYACKVLGIPVRTTWNSVDVSRFALTHSTGDTFLSVNRIDPDKGIHVFVDWIGRAGLKGDVIGDDKFLRDQKNYPAEIRAGCQRYGIKFSGLVSHEEKVQKISDCRAVVLLPQAPKYLEVFGLAAVEANAMGKPVICTPNCGLKNVVVDGETGFFVETFEQFKDAVSKLDTITPEKCRKQAEKFDIPVIAPKYREIIKQVNDGSRW